MNTKQIKAENERHNKTITQIAKEFGYEPELNKQ